MLNPEMVTFLVKTKLSEIIAGQIPESLKLKEKTESKIILTAPELFKDEDLKLNGFNISITFQNIEIIISHE